MALTTKAFLEKRSHISLCCRDYRCKCIKYEAVTVCYVLQAEVLAYRLMDLLEKDHQIYLLVNLYGGLVSIASIFARYLRKTI